jgi:all-trans-retinol 13,14-reductase
MAKIGTPYRRATLDETYDAIVIGSGIGGLATAALLAKHGDKRVLVLERHYTAGGYTHVFRHGDYEWDVGVHYVGDLHEGSDLRLMFDEITDGALKWEPMGQVHDRIVIGQQSYELPAGKDVLRAKLKGYFPDEAAAIDDYIRLCEDVVRASRGYFAEKAVPSLIARIGGGMMRRKFVDYASRTTREVLEELTDNQTLVAVLSGQFFTYGLTPGESSFGVHAVVAQHYFEGGYYPVGGASCIAATILPVIEARGGIVVTRADVEEIICERGRATGVRLADGNEFRAPIVVSAAGVPTTFGKLVPRDLVSRHRLDRFENNLRPSIAHVCLYVGLRHTAEDLGLERSNFFVYPSTDYERDHAAYAEDPDGTLPVVYLSFPSAKDPSFQQRMPGRATIDVMAPAPYELFAEWADERWQHRGERYESLKQRYAERLLDVLFRFVPQVEGKIDYCELSTPVSTRHFAGYRNGEIYGMAATPERLCERDLRAQTPVPGLYLAGQDVGLLGVAGALFGGVIAASAVLGRDIGRNVRKQYQRHTDRVP